METKNDPNASRPASSARGEARAHRSGHDIVVIGGSAGAVEPLMRITSALPSTLPATIFVVVHRGAESPPLLAQVLRRSGGLQVMEAVDLLPIERGTVYVARPDRHLLVEENRVRVVRGPKENRHRPAIDPLFRSAAWAYGPRVVGVLLSGGMNDGTAGLWAIQSSGGTTIVQEPSDERFPSMHKSALETLDVDHCVRADAIAALIEQFAHQPAPDQSDFPVPKQVRLESQMVQMKKDDIEHVSSIGTLTPFTCPACHGALWEIDDERLLRYRCHTGHAFTAESLSMDEDETVEEAVYSALRVLEESAALSRRLAQRAHDRSHVTLARSLERKARSADRNADALRKVLFAEGEHDEGHAGTPKSTPRRAPP